MANKIKDLSGARVGKLIVIGQSGLDDYSRALWLCKCDCGNEVIRKSGTLSDAIKNSKSSHCGCSPARLRHGLTKANKRLYWVWAAIIQRCENKSSKDYSDYGGRGITVCHEWRENFENFYGWALSAGYAQGLTIDRIENEKGYFPENCQWVTIKDQIRNQRKTVFIEWNGEKRSLSEWAERQGLSEKTLRARLFSYKWPVEKALTEKAVKGKNQHSRGSHATV